MGDVVGENVTSASILRLNSLRRTVLKASGLISITLHFAGANEDLPDHDTESGHGIRCTVGTRGL
jgi:hypothetical protein